MSLEQLESRQLLTGTPWDGAELVIADFDGDGNLDRLRAAASGANPETWIIDSKISAAAGTVETWKVTRGVGTPASGVPAASELLVGDFNGDGRDDLLSKTGASNWYVITSRASISPTQFNGEFLVLPHWGAPATAGGWSAPIVGDFNGDGRDDIAAFDATNPADKQWQVSISTGTAFLPVEAWATQSLISPTAGSIVAGDFNGDGRDDLLFKKTGTNYWAVAISDGSRFNIFDSSSPVSTTWTSKLIGDFDGDGSDELLGWNSAAGRWETVRYGDHRGLTVDTSWGNHLSAIVTDSNLHIGDANRDGRDDLIAFNTGASAWTVALSQQTAAGTNAFTYTAPQGDGTNNWGRWFGDWDWGPTTAPYKFLNIDAPYQKFLDIFEDVYNNVELELYPGLMKGIEATAQTKAGNDWDQAALLVNRLEAAGFDADIAYGRVTADGQQVAKWIGAKTVGAAFNMIKGAVDGNATQLTDVIRFKHAWVQAKVPTASGFITIDIDPSWKFKDRQPGDAINLTNIATNYAPISGRSGRGTFDEFGYFQSSTPNQLPVEWYEDQVMRYLVTSGANKSLADVSNDGPIIKKQYSTLPIGWDGNVVTIDYSVAVQTFANLNAIAADPQDKINFTHRVTIEIGKNLGVQHIAQTFVVPKHSLDAINVSYVQSSSAYSARLIVTPTSGAPITYFPPGNQTFLPGDNVRIEISHKGPAALFIDDPRKTTYTRKPGQILAIGLDANQYSTGHIVDLQDKLNSAMADGVSTSDIDELLSYTSAKYWYEFNQSVRSIDSLLHTIGGEQWVGSGIITSEPYLLTEPIPGVNGGNPIYSINDLSHLQFPILPYGMGVDLPNANHVSFYAGIGANLSSEAFQLGGFNASALENAILEEVINSESISTVRGLQRAFEKLPGLRYNNATDTNDRIQVFESVPNGSGRTIYFRGTVGDSSSYDPDRIDIPRTRSELISLENGGLRNHVDHAERIADILENIGGEATGIIRVLVPKSRSLVGSWSGTVYTVEYITPSGAIGSYTIAPDGGSPTNGGYGGNIRKPENKVLPSATFVHQTYAGDPVNVANGNMFRDEVDFTFANPIVPLDFGRHYDSQNRFDVGFGAGWVHSFTGIVYEEDDQANSGDKDYVWLRGSGERHTFETLDFTLPNTLFGDVETTGSGTAKRLSAFQDRSGLQYIFEPIADPNSFVDAGIGKRVYGRLVAILDATGLQGVTITYDDSPSVKSVRVKEVRSLATPSRYLQFVHGANGVEVKRLDGGQVVSTWAYTLATHASYSGKRLTQVKHANQTATATNYMYYTDGPASRRGLIHKIIEPNLESHSYEYYANGRVFRVTDGAGNHESFNYNLFRNLTEFTDQNGNVETYIHQENGLLLKQIHDDRSRLEYTWGPQSTNGVVQWEEFLMRSSTDERGGTEVFHYHPFSPSNALHRPGELSQSTAKDGTVTTFTYKPHDYISSVLSTSETPPSGTALQTAEFTYDEYGHILTAKDAAGHITKYEYFDATAPAHLRGLRKSETRPKGVSNQSLAAGETYEAVPWKVLDGAFNITGNTISVELRTLANGQPVVADAIRIDRMDKDGVFTQVIDSSAVASSKFRLGASGGTV